MNPHYAIKCALHFLRILLNYLKLTLLHCMSLRAERITGLQLHNCIATLKSYINIKIICTSGRAANSVNIKPFRTLD